MRNLDLLLLLPLACFAMDGCETTGHVGLVTRSSVAPESLLTSGKAYQELGTVWGKICGSPYVWFLGGPADNFAKVIDDALKHFDADALINVTTSTHRKGSVWKNYRCTKVQGTAIKFIDTAPR